MNDPSPVQVEFTPLFERFIKHLARKFRHIRKDLEPLITRLEKGETPGNQVKGTQRTVYKVRVKNTDVQKGKSGGYRVIYYLKTTNRVILLAIYAKTERVDIQTNEIRRMIEDYEELTN